MITSQNKELEDLQKCAVKISKLAKDRERVWSVFAWILCLVSLILFYKTFYEIYMEGVGPLVCKDGWRSFSIGTQGACSQHGGIDYSPVYRARRNAWIFSVPLSLICWITVMWIEGLTSQHKRKAEKVRSEIIYKTSLYQAPERPEQLGGCPRCGGELTSTVKYYNNRAPDRSIKQKCKTCNWSDFLFLE